MGLQGHRPAPLMPLAIPQPQAGRFDIGVRQEKHLLRIYLGEVLS